MTARRLFSPKLSAAFDAASRTPDAMRHWSGADALSADAELIPEVRSLTVSRCRYEAANNGDLAGILLTLADDTIGTGPRLQLYPDAPDPDADDREIRKRLARRERRFRQYALAIGLARKLRLARLAKARDGEVFFRKVLNPRLAGPNRVDLVLYEAEQVASAVANVDLDYHDTGVPKEVDGVFFDRFGNPEKYRFWRVHPGALNRVTGEYTDVPADTVIHYANFTRPGQHRGFPEIAPVLTVFNDLRRYSNAVVAAAETAAVISIVLETDTVPDPEDYALGDDEFDPESGKRLRQLKFTDVVPLVKNSAIALPESWHAKQIQAEQPTTQFPAFSDAKLNEAARALSMPFNVAKGNSAGYNYASGRLDYQIYHRKLAIERELIASVVLDDIYATWETIDRAVNPEDYPEEEIAHTWMWDGFEHADPLKEANAQAARLASGVSTLAEECARAGTDYETVMYQRAREQALARKLNLAPAQDAARSEGEEDDE